MRETDVAIIGGSAAGLMAASTIKRRAPGKTVVMIRDVEKTPVPCGIPYIYGTLHDVGKNIIADEGFQALGVEIITKRVHRVARERKCIFFSDGEPLHYGKLVLATGSKAFVPPIQGTDLENVYVIKKDPIHLETLRGALAAARNVVVIGGGFIGVEMAEQIAQMGQGSERAGPRVSIVEVLPHCLLMACEEEFCLESEAELEKLGVQVFTNSRAEAILGEGQVRGVRLADGRELPADLVVIGIGAVPNVDLAQDMGLKADPKDGIAVDAYLRTDDPNVFAAGDCAAKTSIFTGEPCGIRLASVATCEGMIAASNLDRPTRKTLGAIGAFATTINGRNFAAAGLTTRMAAAAGIEVVVGEAVVPNRHPGGLPGCVADMKAKLLFRRDDGRIVGGHISGSEAAADMVNLVSVSVQAGLTAEDLATMQYATHPLLTASPLAYHVMIAAEKASAALHNGSYPAKKSA